MFKCLDCDAVFPEDEIATWEESRGEFWGMPCYEKMCGCPYCYSTSIEEYFEVTENEEPDTEGENENDSGTDKREAL